MGWVDLHPERSIVFHITRKGCVIGLGREEHSAHAQSVRF